MKLREHKHRKLNGHVYSFLLFLRPLGLTIELNSNISKVAYMPHVRTHCFCH